MKIHGRNHQDYDFAHPEKQNLNLANPRILKTLQDCMNSSAMTTLMVDECSLDYFFSTKKDVEKS
jgi:hypothetical protein